LAEEIAQLGHRFGSSDFWDFRARFAVLALAKSSTFRSKAEKETDEAKPFPASKELFSIIECQHSRCRRALDAVPCISYGHGAIVGEQRQR